MKKVLLALSGGVDSSVSLMYLKNNGFDTEAVVMEMSDEHKSTVEAAKEVAEKLSVPIHVINAHREFSENVVLPFCKTYLCGKTPNPCIICNPTVKFRLLYDFAVKGGFDYIATGHYARITEKDGKKYIGVAANKSKDQSYMLYRLPPEMIDRLIFPLGETEDKNTVREDALSRGIPSASKPDSQEICFIPDNDYGKFIEDRFGKSKSGMFIGPGGENLGKNKGILHYTVGQRKGLNISYSEPLYVKKIDAATGDVFLCRKGEEYFRKVTLSSVYMPYGQSGEFDAFVKIRYASPPVAAHIKPGPGDTAVVFFESPQRACCPGQSVVFYDGDAVLGGGFIEENL